LRRSHELTRKVLHNADGLPDAVVSVRLSGAACVLAETKGKGEGQTMIGGRVEGLPELSAALERVADDAVDLRRVDAQLEARFHEGNREQFDSEGGRSGGWKPRVEAQGTFAGRPLEQLSGRLRNSLTGRTSDSIHRVDKDSAEFGTSVPYALVQHEGNALGTLPGRPLVVVTPEDERDYLGIVADDAAAFIRSLGLEVV
jgi:phage gpG-like protein